MKKQASYVPLVAVVVAVLAVGIVFAQSAFAQDNSQQNTDEQGNTAFRGAGIAVPSNAGDFVAIRLVADTDAKTNSNTGITSSGMLMLGKDKYYITNFVLQGSSATGTINTASGSGLTSTGSFTLTSSVQGKWTGTVTVNGNTYAAYVFGAQLTASSEGFEHGFGWGFGHGAGLGRMKAMHETMEHNGMMETDDD